MPYQLVEPPAEPLARIGHWPDPFKWPPFPPPPIADCEPHDLKNRWDDPNGEFITLYAASDILGAFVEILPYFRGTDEEFLAKVHAEVDDEGADVEVEYEHTVTPGLFKRLLGRARILDPDVRFVDVDDPRTHTQLTRELPKLLAAHGHPEFDRGVVMSNKRILTRAVAGHLHERFHGHEFDGLRVAGIRFESRRYRQQTCWAIWDDAGIVFPVDQVDSDPIVPAIPELIEAAKLLSVRLPDDV